MMKRLALLLLLLRNSESVSNCRNALLNSARLRKEEEEGSRLVCRENPWHMQVVVGVGVAVVVLDSEF